MGYLKQAWLVLLLAMVFGSALAAMQISLSERIEQNKRDETFGQIPSLVPGGSVEKTEETTWGSKGRAVYKVNNDAGEHVGWVLPADGMGFADRIEILIGLNADATRLTGLYVLDQKETPGLGNKITMRADSPQEAPLFLDNFTGKDATEPLEVVKRQPQDGANEVEAITGATVSSQAVTDIVNETVSAFRAAKGLGDDGNELTGGDDGQ
jgi:electron transport complex protein RnfG